LFCERFILVQFSGQGKCTEHATVLRLFGSIIPFGYGRRTVARLTNPSFSTFAEFSEAFLRECVSTRDASRAVKEEMLRFDAREVASAESKAKTRPILAIANGTRKSYLSLSILDRQP
jgi:hypothetical protein